MSCLALKWVTMNIKNIKHTVSLHNHHVPIIAIIWLICQQPFCLDRSIVRSGFYNIYLYNNHSFSNPFFSKQIIPGGNKHVADNIIRNQIGIQQTYKDKPTKLSLPKSTGQETKTLFNNHSSFTISFSKEYYNKYYF